MVSPFLAPETVWHMMHKNSDAMGMNQRVAPFLDWLRAVTIDPLQGIAALTSVDLVDDTMVQQQGIRTSLTPPPPSISSDPEYPTAAALPDASAVPTTSSHKAGGDTNRAVGGGSTEPLLDFQC